MSLSPPRTLGRRPTVAEFSDLKPLDRLICQVSGRTRIARVVRVEVVNGRRVVMVHLHRTHGVGYVVKPQSILRSDVIDVTHSPSLHIDASDREAELVGGAA